jgi:hypothetical protein
MTESRHVVTGIPATYLIGPGFISSRGLVIRIVIFHGLSQYLGIASLPLSTARRLFSKPFLILNHLQVYGGMRDDNDGF